MEYLLEQIFWFLLIAFILGAIVGWFVSAQRCKSTIAELQQRIAELESAGADSAAETRGTPVENIEGIGSGFGQRLRADGIATTEALLELCSSDSGVQRVCQCVDLDENTVHNWGTMADLMRIRGLGGQWAELLWRCGVKSVQDLASREPDALVTRMAEVNTEEHRVYELPGERRVQQFVAEAGQLPPVLPNR